MVYRLLLSCCALSSILATSGRAQDGLLDFASDVQPILTTRCLQCHGPEEAKNDFRVDQWDSLSAYIEPGDLESSSLWADYLLTDDPDMVMPPETAEHPAGLPATELAVIKLWIEEGAVFDWKVEADAQDEAKETSTVPTTVGGKVWAFQGLFHPASTHIPVALLSMSTFFLLLSLVGWKSFEPAAFHCLWVGALGAVAACAMGWSYAVHEGYGSGYTFDLQGRAIDRHRWLGIAVAVLALILIPIAKSAFQNGDLNKKILWVVGSLLVGLGVAMTGYQGGELTYGEDHYEKEFNRLFNSEPSQAVVAEASDSQDAKAASD